MEIISTRRNDHRNDPKGLSARPEGEGHPLNAKPMFNILKSTALATINCA